MIFGEVVIQLIKIFEATRHEVPKENDLIRHKDFLSDKQQRLSEIDLGHKTSLKIWAKDKDSLVRYIAKYENIQKSITDDGDAELYYDFKAIKGGRHYIFRHKGETYEAAQRRFLLELARTHMIERIEGNPVLVFKGRPSELKNVHRIETSVPSLRELCRRKLSMSARERYKIVIEECGYGKNWTSTHFKLAFEGTYNYPYETEAQCNPAIGLEVRLLKMRHTEFAGLNRLYRVVLSKITEIFSNLEGNGSAGLDDSCTVARLAGAPIIGAVDYYVGSGSTAPGNNVRWLVRAYISNIMISGVLVAVNIDITRDISNTMISGVLVADNIDITRDFFE